MRSAGRRRANLQVETGLAAWSLAKAGGTRTELLTLGLSVVKIGITDRSDLHFGVTPYAEFEAKALGWRSRVSGFGDMIVRYKQRLTANGASVQAGIIPFVKLPTAAKGLGNDKLDGGLAVPISFALSGPVTMTLGPEVDLLADTDVEGHHPAIVNLINVSGPITPRLTTAGELWANVNFDPAATIRQASADAALAYAVSNDVQLDAGTNVGLTRGTPGVEFYAGVSFRF